MCPMVNNQIKHALAKVDESAHPEIVSIAKSLKEQGMELHESGDHKKSEELLKAALRLLTKISKKKNGLFLFLTPKIFRPDLKAHF